MAGYRTGQRSGHNEIVFRCAGERCRRAAAHDREGPRDVMTLGGGRDLPARALGGGAPMRLDLIRGQRLHSGSTRRHLARERQSREMPQILVFDKDAVERGFDTRREPCPIAGWLSDAASRVTTTLSTSLLTICLLQPRRYVPARSICEIKPR